MNEIKHHATCSPIYPEKEEGEAPQATITIDIGDGEKVIQCSDCGAFAVVKQEE